MKVKIEHFKMEYSPIKNTGVIQITAHGNPKALTIPINSTEEFTAVSLLLYSGNAFLDADTWTIFDQK